MDNSNQNEAIRSLAFKSISMKFWLCSPHHYCHEITTLTASSTSRTGSIFITRCLQCKSLDFDGVSQTLGSDRAKIKLKWTQNISPCLCCYLLLACANSSESSDSCAMAQLAFRIGMVKYCCFKKLANVRKPTKLDDLQ